MTSDQEPNDLPFEDWARSQYRDIVQRINPCDENGRIDPIRLNEVLTKFCSDFAWAITMQEVEINRHHQMVTEYEIWWKDRLHSALRVINEEQQGGRAPAQATVEARAVNLNPDDYKDKNDQINAQKSRADLLRGLVKVMDRQASILQTLSSNMRSELFFSGGVTMDGRTVGNRTVEQARHALARAKQGDIRQEAD